jgi:hypothetical protein
LTVLILRSRRSRRLEGWPHNGLMVRDARAALLTMRSEKGV